MNDDARTTLRYQRRCQLVAIAYVLVMSGLYLLITVSRTRGVQQQLLSAIESETMLSQQHHPLRKQSVDLQQQELLLQEELSQQRKRVPAFVRETELLTEIEDLTALHAARLLAFRPLAGTTAASGNRIRVELVVEADFAACYRFLYEIRELERLCDVRQLEISPGSSAGLQHMTLELHVFHQIPATVAESGEGAVR
ncbi:MAG: type 4a pilus biogenesis protein PilO [Planctomycetaceae bacterium]|nr:type 4a pilus biogenesis protein PilO [Planctomycetaceae bacterium]